MTRKQPMGGGEILGGAEKSMADFEDESWYLVIERIRNQTEVIGREFYGPFAVRFDERTGPNIKLVEMGFKLDPESDGGFYTKRITPEEVVWVNFKKGKWIKEGSAGENLHMSGSIWVEGEYTDGPKAGEIIQPADSFITSKLIS